MSQLNETVRIVLGYLFAFFVVGICFWFMDRAFLDPETASIPPEQSGLIVGGILTLATGAATFVFSQAVMNAAARSAATSTAAGVNAALTQPTSSQTITATGGDPAMEVKVEPAAPTEVVRE